MVFVEFVCFTVVVGDEAPTTRTDIASDQIGYVFVETEKEQLQFGRFLVNEDVL